MQGNHTQRGKDINGSFNVGHSVFIDHSSSATSPGRLDFRGEAARLQTEFTTAKIAQAVMSCRNIERIGVTEKGVPQTAEYLNREVL